MAGASTIPNDMVLWLDGTQGITPDGTGLRCASWTSLVGGHVLSQPTAGLQPTLTTLNGLQCIQTDGVDDYLSNTTLFLPQPCTWFLVMKEAYLPSVGNNQAILDGKPGSPSGRQLISLNGTSPTRYTYAATNQIIGSSVDTNPHVLSVFFNNASSVGYVDGIAVASGSTSNQSQDGVTIGTRGQSGGSAFPGWVCEILAYPRQLSSTELATVQVYLKSKWATV
jgi:hypothetical protein